MPHNMESTRRIHNSYSSNSNIDDRPRNPQYSQTRNNTAYKTIKTHKRKRESTLIYVTCQSNGPSIQDGNTFVSRSNVGKQRDASSNNKRRKIDHTNNDTVPNPHDLCSKNNTILHNDDNEANSLQRRHTLLYNTEETGSFYTTEKNSSIPGKSKTNQENQAKVESKQSRIPKKVYNEALSSVPKPTEANHIDDVSKTLTKITMKVSDQNDTSSLKTDQIKQFKILLCNVSSKIQDGWQVDISGLSLENLRTGEINFIKESGDEKLYSTYEVKYKPTSITSSKDTKLNYATFSRLDIKKYFQRYLNFCNNRPSDSLKEFGVDCNIKLNSATFDKHGIDIVYLGSNTYKLEIQHSYKKDIEKLGLYKKCLSCRTLPKLAELIDDCLTKDSGHFNNPLLRKYFLTFISEKIFEKKEEKEKYILKFHQDFIKENNLSESAKELRRLLLKRIKFTDKMGFTVSNRKCKEYEKNPIEPLPVEKYDMFQNFLDIFRFKVVDSDIDAMVEDIISKPFTAIDNDWYLNAVQVKFYKILELGHLSSQLFQFLEREIYKCNVIKRLQEEPYFQQENIKFENIGLKRIYQYLTDGSKKVVFCSTKHMKITEHKLRQLSDENLGYSENEESLFINNNILFENVEDAIQSFLSYSLKLLVVLVPEKSSVSHARLLKIVNDSFLHEDKSVIVVYSTKSKRFSRPIYHNHNVIFVEDEETSPLKPESLNQLKQSNVMLHGHEVTITELMDEQAIAELIKTPKILEQFLIEKLIFQDILIEPNGIDLKCYEATLRDQSNKICEAIDILKCNSQVALISGESGIGKSFLLYELAEKACNEHIRATLECGDHFWLIQINLNQLPFEELISQDTINILEPLIHYFELNDVQKKVFIMSAEGRLNLKLVLVIDGYDELQPVYKDFALKILHQLKNSSIKKMFIATRDNNIFEITSEVSHYTIEFSVENKKQYCYKYLEGGADYMNNFAKELTSTPLHLEMLQEITSNYERDVAIDGVFDLYKKYAELKINMDHIDTIVGLSAERVLSKEDFQLINFNFQEENLNFSFPKYLQHVTFYEYFTAWWMSGKFIVEVDIRCQILTIVNRLVDKTSPVFLSTFLEALTQEHVDELAQHGFLTILKALLSFKDMKKPNIHLVIEKNKTNAYEVLKCLFEHYKRTNDSQLVEYVNQQINGETPMQVSCRLQKMDLACELMLVGAEVRSLNKKFLIDMTTYVIQEMIRGNSEFGIIVEKLFELSSVALTDLSKELGYQLMKYLFERGQESMIERLLMREPERKKLLTMRFGGESPLDLVNNSRWLDNDQRLKMYKYIILNAGSELEREDKFFIEPVLRGACEGEGSEKIFNYFVDRYPEKRNGFLNTALRKNRLNDVEFVVKISKRKRTIDKEGNMLLHRAIKFGSSDEILDFLIAKEGLKEVNGSKETPLHVAFITGKKFLMIKYLIEQDDSTLLATDKYGLNPWCYALLDRYRRYDKDEQIELMDYLVNYKKIELSINSTSSSKGDAYKKEVTKKLEYFSDPRGYMRDFNANSDLLSRLRSEEGYFCRFMIVHGANVNVRDADGKTALHVALECKLYDLAKLMLQHGAMFDIEDGNNVTPLQQLKNSSDSSRECKRMIDILEHAKKIFSNGKSLAKYLSVDVEQLKSNSMRHIINCRDRRDRTLFHLAALVGDETAVRGVTALSKICCANLTDFPKLDVNDRDIDGRTPLDLAELRRFDRVVDELRLLEAQNG